MQVFESNDGRKLGSCVCTGERSSLQLLQQTYKTTHNTVGWRSKGLLSDSAVLIGKSHNLTVQFDVLLLLVSK